MIYTASRLSTQCADNLGTVKTWLHILIYYFNESDSSSLIFNKTNLNLLLNVLYHIAIEMKIRESCLQTGNFIYKPGISLTKPDFHLQRGSLGLQRGFSGYYLPFVYSNSFDNRHYGIKLLWNDKIRLNWEILGFNNIISFIESNI